MYIQQSFHCVGEQGQSGEQIWEANREVTAENISTL